MKKYFILSVLLLVSGFFASCNYLNIDDYFEDTFQEDSIYANKRNIERYFNGAAALLPVVDKIWEYGNTPGVTGSDEAVSYHGRRLTQHPMGHRHQTCPDDGGSHQSIRRRN